jgi:hypothetical protein
MVRQRWLVGGVVLGLLVLTEASRGDEAAAIQAVEKLGGTVTVNDKQPGKLVVGVDLFRTKVTDAGLKELKELKQQFFSSCTQGPASLPSSWTVRDPGLSWTVIRSMVHSLGCCLS